MISPLKTPTASLSGKKGLLQGMVRNVKPTKMSLKKTSLKSVLGGKKSTGNAGLGSPTATGGSPFALNSGLGAPNSPMMAPGAITSGRGTNLGTQGVF